MKSNNSLVPLMHPTHGGKSLFVGTDIKGLHLYHSVEAYPLGNSAVHWLVEKFPLELFQLIEDFLLEKLSEGFCAYGGIEIELTRLTRVNERTSGLFRMTNAIYTSAIELNADELLQLNNVLRGYFCLAPTMPRIQAIERILAAIKSDIAYRGYTDSVKAALAPFYQNILRILETHLDRKVTAVALFDARIDFLLCCQQYNLVEEIAIACSKSTSFPGAYKDIMEKQYWHTVSVLLQTALTLRNCIRESMGTAGITEELYLGKRGLNLRPELLQKYKAGQLTMRDVLIAQPMIIVRLF